MSVVRNLGLVIRDRRTVFECLEQLCGERYTCTLLLDTNRNSYIGSPTEPIGLILGDLGRLN